MDLYKVMAFGGFRVVSWRGGSPGGGSRVGRGRIVRLGCGQATMAVRAAWLWMLADQGGGGGAEAPGYITDRVRPLVYGEGICGRRVPPTPSILLRVKT